MQGILNAQDVQGLREFGVWNDGLQGAPGAANGWEATTDAAGTVTINNEHGGGLAITEAGTDNAETYLNTINEPFDIGSRQPIFAVCRLKYTEANTDDANVAFGLSTGTAADNIVDDGAGLDAGGIVVAAIYKVDGGTVWKTRTLMDAVTKSNDTEVTPGGGVYQTLAIKIQPQVHMDLIEVTYFIDAGSNTKRFYSDNTKDGMLDLHQMKDDTDFRNLIQHRVTVPASTTCDVFVGVKNGSANAETVYVDFIGCWSVRNHNN